MPQNTSNNEHNIPSFGDYLKHQLRPSQDAYDKLKQQVEALTAENQRLKEALEKLPNEKEISQVACDEMQQDWVDLRFQDVYKNGFIWGAIWMKRKVEQALNK